MFPVLKKPTVLRTYHAPNTTSDSTVYGVGGLEVEVPTPLMNHLQQKTITLAKENPIMKLLARDKDLGAFTDVYIGKLPMFDADLELNKTRLAQPVPLTSFQPVPSLRLPALKLRDLERPHPKHRAPLSLKRSPVIEYSVFATPRIVRPSDVERLHKRNKVHSNQDGGVHEEQHAQSFEGTSSSFPDSPRYGREGSIDSNSNYNERRRHKRADSLVKESKAEFEEYKKHKNQRKTIMQTELQLLEEEDSTAQSLLPPRTEANTDMDIDMGVKVTHANLHENYRPLYARSTAKRTLLSEVSLRARRLRRRQDDNAVVRRKTLNMLFQLTDMNNFNASELRVLKRRFEKLSKGDFIQRNGFKKALTSVIPIKNSEFLDRLFDIFRLNKNDEVVTFRDFVCSVMTNLKGPGEDKLRFYFELYDASETSNVLLTDIAKMLYKSTEEVSDLALYVDDVLIAIDTKKNGKLEEKAFLEAAHEEPLIIELLVRCTPLSSFAQLQWLTKLVSTQLDDRWDYLIGLWQRIKSNTASLRMTKKDFVNAMPVLFSEIPNISAEDRELRRGILSKAEWGDIFTALEHKKGTVHLRYFIMSLAQIFTPSYGQLCQLFVALFLDDEGEFLRKDEITKTMEYGQRRLVELTDAGTRWLRETVTNNTGKIHYTEFVQMSQTFPAIYEMLMRMFDPFKMQG